MISHGSTKRIYEWAGAVQCSIHRALLWGQSIRLFPICAKPFDDSGLFTLGHVIIAAHRRDWNGDIFISMKFSLVAATEVVKIIIVGAFSDGNFAKMTPFLFQRWLFWHLISRLPRALHISDNPVASGRSVARAVVPPQVTSTAIYWAINELQSGSPLASQGERITGMTRGEIHPFECRAPRGS